ncbi:MAG: right-handed parallel beta-helix repeat-containing protein, partial [Eubacteriales bacterium]
SGAQYYFYNVLEELDSPGEYYLDRDSGVLYIYPHGKDSVFDISIETSPLISLSGAEHMTLSGFTLTCTRETAVTVRGNDNRIDGLLIKNVANHGITAEGLRNTVENCEITRTGRGGIYLSGGDRTSLTPGENRAVNNFIHDFSEVYQTYQSGVNLSGVGNICAHNEISGSPHMAIGYSGNEHLIEYNSIHDVVLHSSDAGAIYSGFDWAAHGTVIRYNLLRDIGAGDFFPDGIYWDDGLSGQTAYGNILINVRKYAFLIGGGRDNVVRDNIIIGESREPILYDDRNRDGFVNGGWAHQACDTQDAKHWKNLECVPYRSELWAKKYPTLARIITDFSRFNDPDFPINPANCKVENNVIINRDARFGWMAQSVYDYSEIGENYTYHSCEEAGLDPVTFRFIPERDGFRDLSADEIGRR